jgi:hypothetical protein
MLRRAAVFAGFLLLETSGCRKIVRTNDPQLKPIQEMLDTQLPPGTSEERVKAFLSGQGYVVFPSEKRGTVVAIISTGRNREGSPMTARVTFYFDANGKLNTFEMTRASREAGQR